MQELLNNLEGLDMISGLYMMFRTTLCIASCCVGCAYLNLKPTRLHRLWPVFGCMDENLCNQRLCSEALSDSSGILDPSVPLIKRELSTCRDPAGPRAAAGALPRSAKHHACALRVPKSRRSPGCCSIWHEPGDGLITGFTCS